MQEILDVPDNIPQELLQKAECVVVIPSMTKVALGIGASCGRGAMACRSGKAFTGPWGAPAMYALESGSVGWQVGGESTDVVFLVMNRRGVDALLGSYCVWNWMFPHAGFFETATLLTCRCRPCGPGSRASRPARHSTGSGRPGSSCPDRSPRARCPRPGCTCHARCRRGRRLTGRR